MKRFIFQPEHNFIYVSYKVTFTYNCGHHSQRFFDSAKDAFSFVDDAKNYASDIKLWENSRMRGEYSYMNKNHKAILIAAF